MTLSRRIRIPSDLAHFISHLPPPTKRKVRGGLEALLKNPQEGKPLRAELSGLRSLQVGRLRIIYRHQGTLLEIVAIGPRDTIYQSLPSQLRNIEKSKKK